MRVCITLALLVACSSPAPAEQIPAGDVSAGGAVSALAAATAEGGTPEVPLTDDELGRRLDALEQEIGR